MVKQNGKSEPAEAEGRRPRTFDLDDIDPEDAVVIDKRSYRLTRSGGLSLVQQAALSRAWKRMKAIAAKVEKGNAPTETERLEYRQLSEEVVSLALCDAPAEVVHRLSDEQLGRVILVFFVRASSASGLAATMRDLLSGLPTSGQRSPDSNGSTAETP